MMAASESLHCVLKIILLLSIFKESQCSCLSVSKLEELLPWTRTATGKESISRDEINCYGKVVAWEVAVDDGSQDVHGAIWRPTEGSTTEFTLIGLNKLYDTADAGIKTYRVPLDEQITCHPGDRFGVFTPSSSNPQIKCKAPAWSGIILFNIDSLTPGQVLDTTGFDSDGSAFAIYPIIVSQQNYKPLMDKSCNQNIIETTTFSSSLKGQCAAYCGIIGTCQAFTTKNGQCHLHSTAITDENDPGLTNDVGAAYYYRYQ